MQLFAKEFRTFLDLISLSIISIVSEILTTGQTYVQAD